MIFKGKNTVLLYLVTLIPSHFIPNYDRADNSWLTKSIFKLYTLEFNETAYFTAKKQLIIFHSKIS